MLSLSDFPAIDKGTLLSHFHEIVTVGNLKQEELHRFDAGESTDCRLYGGKYHVVHSSGSMGNPGCFAYDEAA